MMEKVYLFGTMYVFSVYIFNRITKLYKDYGTNIEGKEDLFFSFIPIVNTVLSIAWGIFLYFMIRNVGKKEIKHAKRIVADKEWFPGKYYI